MAAADAARSEGAAPPVDDVTGNPVWSRTVERGPDGALRVGGADVRDIAAEHGTPAYVVDEDDFRARARAFRTEFAAAFAPLGTEVDVYYAGKAFLSVAIARWAHEEGLRIDAATGGELAVALRAGVPGPHIGMHGNNKSDEELRRAVEAGVGRIVIDSMGEIERVAAAVRDVRAARGDDTRVHVMVRVTTGVRAGGHEFISTAHLDQKFGLPLAGGHALAALLAIREHPELVLLGAHCHIGSQIQDTTAFELTARRLLELRADLHARTGYLLPELDFGGGYGIAYLPDDDPLDVPGVARALAAVVADHTAESGLPVPRISIEPGRAVVGPTTMTLYRVGVVKPVTLDDGVRVYVAVDGGMSDNLRPALYGANYHAVLADRTSAAEPVRSRVVGKHCETGDIVVHDVDLPADVAPGDLLAVPATGAYGRSMASNYNLIPRPPVLAVRDGRVRVIVRRETEDDLFALDVG